MNEQYLNASLWLVSRKRIKKDTYSRYVSAIFHISSSTRYLAHPLPRPQKIYFSNNLSI